MNSTTNQLLVVIIGLLCVLLIVAVAVGARAKEQRRDQNVIACSQIPYSDTRVPICAKYQP